MMQLQPRKTNIRLSNAAQNNQGTVQPDRFDPFELLFCATDRNFRDTSFFFAYFHQSLGFHPFFSNILSHWDLVQRDDFPISTSTLNGVLRPSGTEKDDLVGS